MNKRLTKLKEKKQFAKIYLSDSDDFGITHFEGIVLDHNEDFIMMLDIQDFNYDGYVVFRKKDVSEIKRTKNEVFFQKILEKEDILKDIFQKLKTIELNSMSKMFKALKKNKTPIIIERKYKDDDIFQIGPVHSVGKNKVRIRYFNAQGEYDFKPVSSKFKDITFFRIGDPYSKLFHKYAKKVK